MFNERSFKTTSGRIHINHQTSIAMEHDTSIRRCISYDQKYKEKFERHVDEVYYYLLQEREARFAQQDIDTGAGIFAPRNSPDLPMPDMYPQRPASPISNSGAGEKNLFISKKRIYVTVGIALTAWMTAEIINQYKKISAQEWEVLNKTEQTKLLLVRTAQAMGSRLRQLRECIKFKNL